MEYHRHVSPHHLNKHVSLICWRQALLSEVESTSREFFSLPEEEKEEIAMHKGGSVRGISRGPSHSLDTSFVVDSPTQAWRGWFPLGDEFTSGLRDGKAGIYFGTESTTEEEGQSRPLHGRNLMPRRPESLGRAVNDYMAQATALAQTLMQGIAQALGLRPSYFEDDITQDPTVLFRIFHYPPSDPVTYPWGVGEHSDYGLLTLLCVDHCGGLQVQHKDGDWIEVPPPEEGTNHIIINLGDMLDRITKGRYRSTPHRVANTGQGKDRISFPLFYDPGWESIVQVLPIEPAGERAKRWDDVALEEWRGTHGAYLMRKVSKCFPQLFGAAIAATAVAPPPPLPG